MPLALDGHAHVNGASSLALTTTQANDVIVLFVVFNNGGAGSATSVTDNSGVTSGWTRRASNSSSNPGQSGIDEWFTTASVPLSGATITVNFAATPSFITIDVFGVSGARLSPSPFSGAAVSANTDPATISTTDANTIVIGGFRESAAGSPTAGAGFTQISGANFLLSEYQIFAATQTNLSVTQSPAGGSNGCIADAIVAAAAAAQTQFTVSGAGVALAFAEFFTDVVLTDAPVTRRTN